MKYNIGDLVWAMVDGHIRQGVIETRSFTETQADDLEIYKTEDYTVRFTKRRSMSFSASELYKTIEELITERTIPYEPGN